MREHNSARGGGQHTPETPQTPRGALSETSPSLPSLARGVVRLTVDGVRVSLDIPAGWRPPAAVREALDPLRADLLRALAPELPHVDLWPLSWRELFEERASIVAESGASDVEALAIAETELRLAVWRGDVEALEAVDVAGAA